MHCSLVSLENCYVTDFLVYVKTVMRPIFLFYLKTGTQPTFASANIFGQAAVYGNMSGNTSA